ncbi:unnamed protein product [Zymoseptoria tritici ST99CH_3D1]|uniref:Glycoside hydrolase 131 catalytic N-terminal domain-containing protein n=2 Tax=Zymoseptoria tritici TaxID=1047171 RepID=A0A1X7RVI9_ZYMT9|nr:unnamed protein product [Zymoseptoria tritici ST99CH_3D7]SMR53428.1 unnamed protein product [Zymoseptoria tritici ST99CH_1E4]SMR55852.1 unnamed protein product [Zymoseptoria tritici ST99CH_3D1]
MIPSLCFTVLLATAVSASAKDYSNLRTISLEARIPFNATGVDFDNGLLPFNPTSVHGKDQTFADVLQFPLVPPSLNDRPTDKAVEVTLNDKSIFAPSATNVQTGFRRTELIPTNKDASATASTEGVQKWHLSIRQDDTRPLNFSHEYYFFWLERADYSSNPFTLGTGTLFGDGDNKTSAQEAEQLWLRSSDASKQETLWQVPFTTGVWHNVAILLDFNQNLLQVEYSIDNQEPVKKTGLIPNDLSGNGQFHIGLLKKSTGLNLTDITKQGYQESGIDEGIVFGGAFEELCG